MISDDDKAKISKSLIKTDIEIKNKNNLKCKKKTKTENHVKTQQQNKTCKTLLILLLMI